MHTVAEVGANSYPWEQLHLKLPSVLIHVDLHPVSVVSGSHVQRELSLHSSISEIKTIHVKLTEGDVITLINI